MRDQLPSRAGPTKQGRECIALIGNQGDVMIQATDPLSSMFKATADVAERYAALTLEGTEGLFKCQLAVARELFTITEKQLAHWSSGNPPSIASMDWETVFRDNGEHAAELSRACA